jgi:hypothetical protein
MMPPTRLLEIILGLAIGTSRQVPVVASGACCSSALVPLLARLVRQPAHGYYRA